MKHSFNLSFAKFSFLLIFVITIFSFTIFSNAQINPISQDNSNPTLAPIPNPNSQGIINSQINPQSAQKFFSTPIHD